MMQLLIHPASPNCVAVLAAAQVLGLDIDVRHVDLFKEEQRAPEFLHVNPNGLVPVLRDDDFVLWETVAILQYLGTFDSAQGLLPRAERQRADVTRWMAWGLAHWNPALQPFIFERLFKPIKGLGPPDEQRLVGLESTLRQTASVLEAQLSHSEFVCGNELSIADLHLAAYPMYATAAGIELATFPHLRRWLGRVHGLPEWRDATGAAAR